MLKFMLEAYGVAVQENATFEDYEDIPTEINGQEVTTIWIANPAGKPSDIDINRIRRFLDKGDKKIIITYAGVYPETRQFIAANVDYICDALDIQSRPLYIPSIGEYFIQTSNLVSADNAEDYPYNEDYELRYMDNLLHCPR